MSEHTRAEYIAHTVKRLTGILTDCHDIGPMPGEHAPFTEEEQTENVHRWFDALGRGEAPGPIFLFNPDEDIPSSPRESLPADVFPLRFKKPSTPAALPASVRTRFVQLMPQAPAEAPSQDSPSTK